MFRFVKLMFQNVRILTEPAPGPAKKTK